MFAGVLLYSVFCAANILGADVLYSWIRVPHGVDAILLAVAGAVMLLAAAQTAARSTGSSWSYWIVSTLASAAVLAVAGVGTYLRGDASDFARDYFLILFPATAVLVLVPCVFLAIYIVVCAVSGPHSRLARPWQFIYGAAVFAVAGCLGYAVLAMKSRFPEVRVAIFSVGMMSAAAFLLSAVTEGDWPKKASTRVARSIGAILALSVPTALALMG
jgi:hypothetical protein